SIWNVDAALRYGKTARPADVNVTGSGSLAVLVVDPQLNPKSGSGNANHVTCLTPNCDSNACSVWISACVSVLVHAPSTSDASSLVVWITALKLAWQPTLRSSGVSPPRFSRATWIVYGVPR